jgi:hypothetical protein
MKYTLSNRHFVYTPAEVSTALGVRCFLSGMSMRNFARELGVSEGTLVRSMAGKPCRRAVAFLGFEASK